MLIFLPLASTQRPETLAARDRPGLQGPGGLPRPQPPATAFGSGTESGSTLVDHIRVSHLTVIMRLDGLIDVLAGLLLALLLTRRLNCFTHSVVGTSLLFGETLAEFAGDNSLLSVL